MLDAWVEPAYIQLSHLLPGIAVTLVNMPVMSPVPIPGDTWTAELWSTVSAVMKLLMVQ